MLEESCTLDCIYLKIGKMMKKTMILLVTSLSCSGVVFSQDAGIGLMGRISNHVSKDTFTSGLYASKDTYGMRASAVALAVRANPDKPFDYPINGFAWTKSLSGYGNRDSVGIYADNTSNPYHSWEVIANPSYTPTSFTSSQVDDSKIKPGMLIDTDHSPKWSAFVVAVQGKKVITNGWVNNENGKIGTPPNGIGLKINPTSKIWGANFNLFFAENGRAKSGVVQENGVINNVISDPNEINGIDTVILPASKYGGTAAFLARSASSGNMQQWSLGFASQGAKLANFYSYNVNNRNKTEAGFMENSTAKSGMVFNGKNTDSSITWISNGKVAAKISPDGSYEKIVYKTRLVTTSYNITDDYSKYIVNAKNDVKINLPAVKNEAEGLTIQIVNFSGNKIDIEPSNDVVVSGQLGKNITASIVNGKWMVY
ncbi:TPA: hypothetical protein ACH1J4_000297 [Klebsiella pneumoniae]